MFICTLISGFTIAQAEQMQAGILLSSDTKSSAQFEIDTTVLLPYSAVGKTSSSAARGGESKVA